MARAATFTTFINAKTDPSIDSAFSKLQSSAVSSYGTIQRAAEQAQRAAAGLFGGTGAAGAASVLNRSLTEQQRQLTGVINNYGRASTAATGLTESTRRQGNGAQTAARQNEALSRSLRTTATALTVVQGPLGPIAGRVSALANAVEKLTGFRLGLVGVGATLFTIARLGNDYQNVQNRLRPLFETQRQFNSAFSDVVRIAQASRQQLGPLAELYSRITIGGRDIGLSQQRIGRITELASKTATISGGSADIQQRGLVQFSQGLGRGSLQGQDLKAVLEDIPVLGQQIAAGFKNADGSIGTTIGKLRDLGSQGKLTGDAIADALERSGARIDVMFNRLPKTLSTAGVEFKNAVETGVGSIDRAIGLTGGLATGLSLVAENLRGVTALAVGFGVAFVTPKVVGVLTGITDSLKRIAAQTTFNQQRSLAEALSVREVAIENANRAVAARDASAITVAGLKAEEAELIRVLDLTVAQQAANEAAAASIGRSGFSVTGSGKNTQIVSAAAANEALLATERELIVIETELEAVRARLATETAALATTTGVATVATEEMTVATTTALPATGALAGAMGTLKAAGSGVAAFFGGPFGIALGIAAIALFAFSTASNNADTAMQHLGITQDDVAQRFHKIAQEARGASAETQRFARLQILSSLSGKRTDVGDTFQVARRGIIQAASNAGINTADGRELLRIANGLTVRSNVQSVANQVGAIQARNPNAFRGGSGITGFFNGRSSLADPTLGAIVNSLATADTARAAFNVQATQGRAEIAAIGAPAVPTGALAGPRTGAQIRAAAQTLAAQTPVQQARASLATLKAQIDKKTGLLPGKSDVETEQELATAMRAVTDAQSAQTAARRAGTKAAAEQRTEESKAKTEALQAAATKRDEALTELYAQGLNPQTADYKARRDAILNTYDIEIAKIRGLRNEHQSLAAAQEADAKAAAAYAQKMGETRTNILSAYDDTPNATDRADRQIRDLRRAVGSTFNGVQAATADNPLGKGLYTQEMADADAQHIQTGLRKPLKDVVEESERQVEINKLILQGRDAEAEALQTAYGLYDKLGHLSQQEYETLVRNVQRNQAINDLLESRQRIVSIIKGTVDQARDGFEQLLVDLQEGKGGSAVTGFLSQIKKQLFTITARQITENLFSGADAKVRALLQGRSSVDQAIGQFSASVGRVETATDRIVAAFDRASQRLESGGGAGVGGSDGAGDPALGALSLAALSAMGVAASRLRNHSGDISGESLIPTNDVVVTGRSLPSIVRPPSSGASGVAGGKTPPAQAVGATLFSAVGANLDKLVNRIKGRTTQSDGSITNKDGTLTTGSKFFSKIGDTFGKALAGAGNGQFASGIAKAVGLKQSGTGAAIGGAVGQTLFGPIGGFVGGLLGGTIGGLFQKKSTSSTSLSIDKYGQLGAGTVTGSSAATKSQATGLAKSVGQGIQSIADQLGAKITGVSGISLGTNNGNIHVNTVGGQIGKKGSGDINFGQDQEAAAAYAVQAAISKGVITGISQASVNILKSGQDLQLALKKATAIESIPKRLLQLTDPVRAAVTDLNSEFSDLISYLKEGGASAQQFADAQKLYDLQRADAIKTATSQAADAINTFLKDMVGGSSSPLNKLTTYQNAAGELGKFKSDIAGGKIVDQQDLLAAARNFQDASRALNGSSQSFFDDFDSLRALLEKARDNAGITNVTTLPASPFASDSVVQDAISSLTAGQSSQTATLSDKLDQVIAAINDNGGIGSYPVSPSPSYQGSTIGLLPGFGGRLNDTNYA